ncbi:hypothetical protein DSO57_1037055 [Entomophthora muscae]|uniref:Uncharacterized protein n=1 Tax=Entomophthora muscae TaxID=34485 RepID=A0ACC2SZ43_9FUNG|nr:hypothetical protein DSO57_1037055 [Entomophthora muscae]
MPTATIQVPTTPKQAPTSLAPAGQPSGLLQAPSTSPPGPSLPPGPLTTSHSSQSEAGTCPN